MQGHLFKSFLDLMAKPGAKSFSMTKTKNRSQVKPQIKRKGEETVESFLWDTVSHVTSQYKTRYGIDPSWLPSGVDWGRGAEVKIGCHQDTASHLWLCPLAGILSWVAKLQECPGFHLLHFYELSDLYTSCYSGPIHTFKLYMSITYLCWTDSAQSPHFL